MRLCHFATIAALLLVQFATTAQNRADQQHLNDPNSSSLVILGDPQGYEKYDLNQGIFEITTGWIADNVKNMNIKAVLCTGDLVEQNDNNALDSRMLNQSSRQMWESVSRAFERLDGKVPYFVSPGNHDYGFKSSETIQTHFPEYFTFERQGDAIKNILVSEMHNREGKASLENSAYELELPGWSRKLLVVATEFYPSDNVVEWVKGLSKKYADHILVFMTHSYIANEGRSKSKWIEKENYGISKMPGNNSGKELWDKLISQVPNIRLVICGHDATNVEPDGSDNYKNNVGWRVDKNVSGKDVYQMMFNVQTLGGGWEGNGGDGWIRILEFLPDGKTIKVSTYSTLFGISGLTKHLAHRTDPWDQFDFVIE